MSNQRTPLYNWHAAHSARMVPFGGWDMPVQYTSIVAEHNAVRIRTGLFDISHMGRLNIGGPDALPFLETLFTNSVGTMKEGQVRYGLICNETGGILDDVLVYRTQKTFKMVVNASNREKILGWIEVHRGRFDVSIADETFLTTMIAIQGPSAWEISSHLFARTHTDLKYYYAAQNSYDSQPCLISRTGYTGEDGFEIITTNQAGEKLWETLIARGAVPCGLGARDTLRLEAAMPLYGHELNETIDPIRAGLGWAVKLDKGEFIGREALREAAAKQGERPTRIGLELDGRRAAREGCPILVPDGRPIGTVTSGSFAPTIDRPIAMGYVSPGHGAPGTPLHVDIRGTLTTAQVVCLPFYTRRKKSDS
jgi:aminomethyltransferase